jgi:hypothetical protein
MKWVVFCLIAGVAFFHWGRFGYAGMNGRSFQPRAALRAIIYTTLLLWFLAHPEWSTLQIVFLAAIVTATTGAASS